MSEFGRLHLGMPIGLLVPAAIGYWLLPRWLDRANRRDLARSGRATP
jgi:hypothetical protein